MCNYAKTNFEGSFLFLLVEEIVDRIYLIHLFLHDIKITISVITILSNSLLSYNTFKDFQNVFWETDHYMTGLLNRKYI